MEAGAGGWRSILASTVALLHETFGKRVIKVTTLDEVVVISDNLHVFLRVELQNSTCFTCVFEGHVAKRVCFTGVSHPGHSKLRYLMLKINLLT